jgi:predicted TIM-barrel fold metal-dependent hydrolase
MCRVRDHQPEARAGEHQGAVRDRRAAEEHPNIYLGTTILRFFRADPSQAVPTAVAEAVKRVGPERLVWGSNLPEYPHSALWCRQAIERLKLGDEAERLIFGETLSRLYKLA